MDDKTKQDLKHEWKGHGAMILAFLDVVITLAFAHVGEAYHLKFYDGRLLIASILVCYALFKYGHHIVHHSNKAVEKIGQFKKEMIVGVEKV